MGSQSQSTFPVIDLSKEGLNSGTKSWISKCKEVRRALEEYGCFIAEYDKVSLEHHDTILDEMRELFGLPLEVKIQNVSHKPAHGYIGNIAAIPLHEGLGIDRATYVEECENFMNLMWPEGNKHFSENAHRYAKIVAELEQMIVRMVFESYGLEKYLDAHVEATSYLLRFLSYRKPATGEPNIAFVSHTDKSFISILHQNNVKGLELRNEQGEWIGFEPSPSRFVVLTGDACMAWSNNRIKSCYHRVVMRGNEARYALGLFSFRGGTIETPMELVDEEHPLQYKPFNHDGLLEFYNTIDPLKRSERNMIKVYCGI